MSEEFDYNSLLLKAKRFVEYFKISAKELGLHPYLHKENHGNLDKLIPSSVFIKDTNILTAEVLEDLEKYEKYELIEKDWRSRDCLRHAISIIQYYKNNYYTPAWKAEDLANFMLGEPPGDKELNFPYGVLNEIQSVKIEVVERFKNEALDGNADAQLIMALVSPVESTEHRMWLEIAIRFGNKPAWVLLARWMHTYGFFVEAYTLCEFLGYFKGKTLGEVCDELKNRAIEFMPGNNGFPYLDWNVKDSLIVLYLNSVAQQRFSEPVLTIFSGKQGFNSVNDFISYYVSLKDTNLNKANIVYLDLAKNGDANAQMSLAKTYAQYNPGEAYGWLKKAADGGSYDAQFLLGWWLRSKKHFPNTFPDTKWLYYDKLFESKFNNEEHRIAESENLLETAAWNGHVLALCCADFKFSYYSNSRSQTLELLQEDVYLPIEFYSHCLLTSLTKDKFTQDLLTDYIRYSSEHEFDSSLNRLCWLNHGKFGATGQ